MFYSSCVCFASSARFLGVSDVHGDDCWPWDVEDGEGIFVIMRDDRTRSGLKRIRPVARKSLLMFCSEKICVRAVLYIPRKSALST